MKVGILGAGQLGRMLALAGYPLGLEFIFLDPAEEACAAPLGEHLCASYQDEEALRRFCESCDCATFEFENVPTPAASLVAGKVPFYPGPRALEVGQDRLNEKRLFDKLSIPVPKYMPVQTREALQMAAGAIGYPCVLKTRRMGYDGKGQAVLRSADDLDGAWKRLGGQSLILEGFVAFEREVSCIGVRGRDGEMRFYPLVENVHRDGILRLSTPRVNDPLQELAESHLRAVCEEIDYVGVIAFEFFVAGNQLFGNEIAPRVHNSGHWTIDGAVCSQFENHLRAVAGLPLGDTSLRGPVAMINLIGDAPDSSKILGISGNHLHWYGKSPKPLRKIGHVNVTAVTPAELSDRVRVLESLLDDEAQSLA